MEPEHDTIDLSGIADTAPQRKSPPLLWRWMIAGAATLFFSGVFFLGWNILLVVHALRETPRVLEEGDVDEAIALLSSAHESLARLQWAKIPLAPLRVIPFFGEQFQAADLLIDAGSAATDAVSRSLEVSKNLVQHFIHNRSNMRVKMLSREERLDLMRSFLQHAPVVSGARAQLSLALYRVASLQEMSLVPPLSFARDSFLRVGSAMLSVLDTGAPLFEIAPELLGYPRPKTYLFLLQNDREVRATGGFIGTYGLMTFADADLLSMHTENIYNLDDRARRLRIRPPEPMLKYFPKKERWWFLRDSNWSPDFPESAQRAEDFYWKEGGRETLDGVIAMTPQVIASLLWIVGPVTVEQTTFDADHFSEQLEYQVEKGYYQRGIPELQRKEVIGKILGEVLARLYDLPLERAAHVALALKRHLDQKQLLIWLHDRGTQNLIASAGWSGEILTTPGDYLMVVDSNMISAKTDAVMDKTIRQKITPEADGSLRAHVELIYHHRSLPAWNITRYKDYVRVYVPRGSQLVSAQGFVENDRSQEKGTIDISEEHDKVVFGGFLVVEPKGSKTVSLDYILPPTVSDSLRGNRYSLFVQKQPGVMNQQLELDLSGLKIGRNPYPRECKASVANSLFCNATLTVDRQFSFQIQ